MRDGAPGDAQRKLLENLTAEPLEFYGELDDHSARQILGTIRTHSINRREVNLKSKLARIDAVAQPEEHNRVFAELLALGQQKRSLQEELAAGG